MGKWILPIIITIVIATQTISGGVFFLAIVWLIRREPKGYTKSIPAPSEKDKKTAKRIYTWLLLSPFITVPIFLIMVGSFYDSSRSESLVLAALIPAVFHVVLFSGLSSKSRFVFRHTQQAILLVALRAGMAALAVNIGSYPEDGIWFFLVGNGSLWLIGSLWGRSQVIRGDCWWIKRRGEIIVRTPEQLGMLSPEVNLKHSQGLMEGDRETAAKHAVMAFRYGNSSVKDQAVAILDELGEVEMF